MLALHLVTTEGSFFDVGVKFNIPLEELSSADFANAHASVIKSPHYRMIPVDYSYSGIFDSF